MSNVTPIAPPSLYRWRSEKFADQDLSIAGCVVHIDAAGNFPEVVPPQVDAELRRLESEAPKLGYARHAINSEVAHHQRLEAAQNNHKIAQQRVIQARNALEIEMEYEAQCSLEVERVMQLKQRLDAVVSAHASKAKAEAKATAAG